MMLPSPYVLGPVWGGSEFTLSLFKRSKIGAVSKDRNTLSIIWIVNLAAVVASIWLAYHTPGWWLPGQQQLYVAGFVLYVLGMVLRWYSIIHLGRFFTVNVAIAADHKLIQTGPYRWLRHPSYTGGLTTLVGFSLCIGNLASILALVIPCTAVSLWRIHVEEAALTQAFGKDYEDYRRRTKRLVPLIY